MERKWLVRYRVTCRECRVESGRIERAGTPHRAHYKALVRLRKVLTDADRPFAGITILSVEAL